MTSSGTVLGLKGYPNMFGETFERENFSDPEVTL